MANIKLNHIFKVYPNGVKAVNDFCLEIKNEEFVVFVGPSGCGKSTTLRMIAGLEEITAGELYIGETYCNELEPKDRDIAMVFQNYALYPHMTVFDNMAFGLVNRHMPKEEIKERVLKAANILGLNDYLDRKPKEMSGGQCQRVALGRAIVRNPKVFLLDEPLSNLDAKLRATMRTEIAKLHQKLQTTFIYVTHDQVEAMTMGDRIVVMRDGFVQQIDTPKNLYRYPNNKFVAGFIGTPQMNFFSAKLAQNNGKITMQLVDANVSLDIDQKLIQSIDPTYLNGNKDVVFGIRSEHISIVDQFENSVKAKCTITQLEELGTETLVYADLNTNNDKEQIVDSELFKTKIVFKANADFSANTNDIIDIYLDLNHIHFFDAKTEKTINPLLPNHSRVKCSLNGGKIAIGQHIINMPYANNYKNGEYDLYIPTNAVILGEDITGEVINLVSSSNGNMIYVKVNDGIMFVSIDDISKYKLGDKVGISIDNTKIDFYSGDEIMYSSVNTLNYIKGGLSLEKSTDENKQKIKKLYYTIFNSSFLTNNESAYRSFVLVNDKRIFKKEYEFAFKPYDVSISDNGVSATVKEIMDYGKLKFAKVQIENNVFVIQINDTLEIGSEIKLAFNIDNFEVFNPDNKVQLV